MLTLFRQRVMQIDETLFFHLQQFRQLVNSVLYLCGFFILTRILIKDLEKWLFW